MSRFDHFDWLAPWYDRVITPKEPEKLIKLASLPVQGWLLDAGGGTGRVAEMLQHMASRVVVADLSEGMLAKAVGKAGLFAVNSHTEALPFSDEAFDAVVIVDALHHVCDQAVTAGELFRVLKPGGSLVIEEPDIRKPAVKLIALLEKLAFMRSRFLSLEVMARLFAHPSARIRTEREGYTAWVIVEKSGFKLDGAFR
jgi:ubiquinone/menaquinone biosynthesis C-methylase UbiE